MYETWLEGESASDLHRAKIRLGEFKTIYSSFTLTECTGKYQDQKFYKIIFLIKDAWSSVEGYLKVKKMSNSMKVGLKHTQNKIDTVAEQDNLSHFTSFGNYITRNVIVRLRYPFENTTDNT